MLCFLLLLLIFPKAALSEIYPLAKVTIIYEDGSKKEANLSSKTVFIHAEDFYRPQYLILNLPETRKGDFQIEQQEETSIVLSDEGPHLDLVHWKHGYSDWKFLKQVDQNKFIIEDRNTQVFPAYKIKELKRAITKEAAKWPISSEEKVRWLKLAETCKKNSDYCISVSKTILKIESKARREKPYLISIQRPMGC